MNLKSEELQELNQILKKTKLGIPEFRRNVSSSGANYQWLQKVLRNREEIPSRLKELLNLK